MVKCPLSMSLGVIRTHRAYKSAAKLIPSEANSVHIYDEYCNHIEDSMTPK